MKLLVLDDATIRKHLTLAKTIELVEAAFRADALKTATLLPVVGHSTEGGRFSIKTSHLKTEVDKRSLEVFGLKMGSYFPDNTKHALPTHSAAMLLGDPKTGQPAALLAANTITEFRTAAGGAVAATYLSREDSSTIAILGVGHQAKAQIEALQHVRKIRQVNVWGRRNEQAEALAAAFVMSGVKAQAIANAEDAVREADIIVTITPSRSAILLRDWVRNGTHVNAMGSDAPGKQELEPSLIAAAKVVVDNLQQSLTIGELQQSVQTGLMKPENVYATLGELCALLKPGRTTGEEITVFDSSGVSFQDTVVAGYLLALAKEQGWGMEVTL
jgi:alanine dehydrogenase